MEERFCEYERARHAYADSIRACPHNLRWKVWISGARMELLSNDQSRIPVACTLLTRALGEVPKKMRFSVLIEQSRMYEFLGDLPAAREVLRMAQAQNRTEWRVFFENVLLELRAGRIDAAIAEAEAALKVNNKTGRLWAILIHMHAPQSSNHADHSRRSIEEQWSIFHSAIKIVPKSGEVWCEGARLCLNPFAPGYFNLETAKRFLHFAMQFTPQYGDSFIEYLRLQMIIEGTSETLPNLTVAIGNDIVKDPFGFAPVHIRRVQQMCVNADPTYGPSWLRCKREAHWAPVEVLQVASDMIQRHLVASQRQYPHAILHSWKQKALEPMAIAPLIASVVKPVEAVYRSVHRCLDSQSNSLPTLIDSMSRVSVSRDESHDTSAMISDCTYDYVAPTSENHCTNNTLHVHTQWQSDAQFNSTHMLYPAITNLSTSERHWAIYCTDPIVCYSR